MLKLSIAVLIFSTLSLQAWAVDKLPLKRGIYVSTSATCKNAGSADILSYWGDKLNSQRVEGRIKSVSRNGSTFKVVISALDIAENKSIGQLNWVLLISGNSSMRVTSSGSTDDYRWCFARMPR